MGVLLERAIGIEAYKKSRAKGNNAFLSGVDGLTQFLTPRGWAIIDKNEDHTRSDAIALDLLSTAAFAISAFNPPMLAVSIPVKFVSNWYSEHLSR